MKRDNGGEYFFYIVLGVYGLAFAMILPLKSHVKA